MTGSRIIPCGFDPVERIAGNRLGYFQMPEIAESGRLGFVK